MKKAISLVLISLAMVSCNKNNIDPEGPTDVRIYNNTAQTFDNIVVVTTDDDAYAEREHSFGTLAPAAYTEYHRFDIAFPEADISLTIGGITYTTPATSFEYLPYIGQDRITYRITVADAVNHVLDIQTVVEEPIDDL